MQSSLREREGANLSLDFLVGFTVFIIAFIYVATLIPGLLLDLQNKNIDYNACCLPYGSYPYRRPRISEHHGRTPRYILITSSKTGQ